MTRIGLVTTDSPDYARDHLDTDISPLLDALARRGARAERTVWHDPAVDWASYDLVVVRSPWDYSVRAAEFGQWLERAESLSQVLNDPALIRWNMDKRYLAELEAVGVPVVPTTYHRDTDTLAASLAEFDDAADGSSAGAAPHVVVKPAVGAGSRHAGLFAHDDAAALELGRSILEGGGTVMLQPEVPELSAGAEKALYVVDGEVTHAISKGALLARGGGLRGGSYQENPVLVEVTAAEAGFARQVLEATEQVTGLPTPLYGRIDIVGSAEHGRVLLEAELFEPLFNLPLVPEVTEIFADAILARAS